MSDARRPLRRMLDATISTEVPPMRFVFLLTCLSATIGTGCAQDEQALVIHRFLALDPASGCVADPANGKSLAGGVFDIGIAVSARTAGYQVAAAIENRLVEQNPGAS